MRTPEQSRIYNRNYRIANKARLDKRDASYREKYRTKLRIKGRAASLKYRRQLNGRFFQVLNSARKRKIALSLTFEQYKLIVVGGVCHYDSSHPLPKTGYGLDRKDSFGPYSVANCVPCCENCNRIRGKDLISYSEMLKVAKLLRKLRKHEPNRAAS